MRIALLGSTDRVGNQVLRLALGSADSLVAIIRAGAQPGISDARQSVVTIESLAEPEPYNAPLARCEAVISAIGPRRRADVAHTMLAFVSDPRTFGYLKSLAQ